MAESIVPPIVEKACKQCGELKLMYADLAMCDDCIEPLLRIIWGDAYDRVIGQKGVLQPIPSASEPPSRPQRNNRERRRRHK
jgi:hypothetical protein